VAIPDEVAKADSYLPVVGVPTERGDPTINLSRTPHESTPPQIAERKVMYGGGFRLAPRSGDIDGSTPSSELRERVYKVLPDDERVENRISYV
jgi:hypothetical protein